MKNPPEKKVAVTIGVACYNQEPWIEDCIASLFGQTFKDFEIIVVDDGSTDRTGEILTKLAAADTRLHVVQQEHKGPGPGASRNLILELARGRYINFVDGNDLLAPECLEKAYRLAAAGDLDAVAFGWARVRDGTGEIIEEPSDYEALDLNDLDNLKQAFFSGRIGLMPWRHLVKTSLYRDHELSFPDALHEDLYIVPFLYFYGKKFGYVKEILYFWRIRQRQVTRISSAAHIDGVLGAFHSWKKRLLAEGSWSRFRDTCIEGILFPHVPNLLKRIRIFGNNDPALLHYLRARIRAIPEFEQYHRNLSPEGRQHNAKLVAFLEGKPRVSAMTRKEPIIVWCGRFLQICGYRAVTVNHVKGLTELGLRVAMFDTQSMTFIDSGMSKFLQVTTTKTVGGEEDELRIKARHPDDRVVVVVHENPEVFGFDRVRVDGLARIIGHAVFETDRLPANWPQLIASLDEFWVASEFNRLTFEGAGIPSFMLNKIPHSLDTELYGRDIGRIRFANDDAIEFLTVCTSTLRRDLGLAIRGFYHAFSNDDSACFVVKLAGQAAKPDSVSLIQSMIEEAALPYRDIDSCLADKIILIKQDFSDEDMVLLYQGCDVYLSIERANGWDFPSMEAMACGKPSIGYYVGGSTEYRDGNTSLSLPVMDETISIPTAGYHPLYTGQVWPVVNENGLVAAMVKAKDAELRSVLGKAAKSRIARWFDIRVVAENIRSLVSTYTVTDYRSNCPAQITIGRSSTWRTASTDPQMVSDLLSGMLTNPTRALPGRLLDTRALIRSLSEDDLQNLFAGVVPGSVTDALREALSIPWRRTFTKLRLINRCLALSRRRVKTLKGQGLQGVPRGLQAIMRGKYDPMRKITEDEIENRKRAFGMYPLLPLSRSERSRLNSLRGRYRGERCFVIGNGPSLNDLDLSKLANEYTFGVNKIYLLFDRIDWRPSFYTLLDWRTGPDIVPAIGRMSDSLKFLPNRFRGLFSEDSSTYWITTRPVLDNINDQFRTDIMDGIPSKGSILVTAIQIAFFLGFRDIYLIGVDANYSIPDTVIQSGPDKFRTGTKLYLESTKNDDPNHFDPSYFGKGSKWHNPNVDEMIRQYKNMRKGVEFHGGRIRNATHGGKLEIFERVDFDSLFNL